MRERPQGRAETTNRATRAGVVGRPRRDQPAVPNENTPGPPGGSGAKFLLGVYAMPRAGDACGFVRAKAAPYRYVK